MNRILKISAIAVATAALALPALAAGSTTAKPAASSMSAMKPAAVDNATVVMGTAKLALPVASLTKLVGHWTASEISGLDHAKTVTVFEKTVYSAGDQAKLDAAIKADKATLAKLQAAVGKDAALSAWLAKNKIAPTSVIAISDQKGKFGLYLG